MHFRVSPFLNLYYGLEVTTGTVAESYNEDYGERMSKLFPEQILREFEELHDAQKLSWRVKQCLFEGISESRLNESMSLLSDRFTDLLNDAFSYYREYWEEHGPSLVKA